MAASGAGWLVAAHANDRGSHKSYNLSAIFKNSSKEDIRGIINRFYMDFRLCGYDDTLEELETLSNF